MGWQKGVSGNPSGLWKPGQSGNQNGMKHRALCQHLMAKYQLDEEIAMMAKREGRYKKVPFRDQISAYEALRDAAYGKPATIQIANFNEVQFVKRIVGVDQEEV